VRTRALAVLLLLSTGLVAPALVGATRASAAGASSLTLTAQPTTTTLATDFTYTVRVANAPAAPSVRTTVYERLTTRSAFDRIPEGRNLGAALSRVTSPVAATDAPTVITIPLVGSPTEGPAINVTQTGVYPVRVELFADGAPTGDTFTTFLTTVPAGEPPVNEALTVATIVPVVEQPAYAANGDPEPAAIATRQPLGRLGRLAAGLARTPAVPLTLTFGGETLSSWAGLARDDAAINDTLTQLRAASASRQRIANTFVPIDAPSLRDAGLEPTVRDEYTEGFNAVTASLESRVDARTASPNPVDTGTLDVLAARGIDQLILAPSALRPIEARLTPARPFLVDGPDRQFRAVSADPGLERAASGTDGPIVTAQRVLAGLALVALEAPNAKRGVTFSLPADLDADPAFYDALLAGLQTSPYLRAATLDALLADVPLDATSAGPLVRTLAAPNLQPVTVTPAEVERSRQRAAALDTLVARTDERAVRARNALVIAPTSLWTGNEGRRRAADELTGVDASLKNAGAAIRAPENRTFQLTGKRDKIPLTFVNTSTETVDVRIKLDGSRISFPDGAEQTVRLPANKSTTIQVAVEPRTSGRYPFQLTMSTTAGNVQLDKTQLTVNASVVSGVGLFLAGGAGLFLAAWWGHYVWKRRRRPQTSAPLPAAAAPEEQTA